LNRILTILTLLSLAVTAYGQDLHFTQFYASPLTLNPSETGKIAEDWRVGGNLKQQWPWAKQARQHNFLTYSAYGDIALLRSVLPEGDWLGVGLVILNDRAGDGNLKTTKLFLSAAYHKRMGYDGKYMLSLGIGGGFVQKQVDVDRLIFNNQWQDFFFDSDAPTGENISGDETLRYFDMNSGVTFTYIHNRDISASLGVGINHLTRPKESFTSTKDNRLGIRPVINGKSSIRFNKIWHIEPSFVYMYQKKAQEIIINTIGGYTLQSGPIHGSIIYAGFSYRAKDALSPVVGFEYERVRILANYDINLSTLTPASNGVGGFEISVEYRGIFPNNTNIRLVPCPRL